MSLSEEIQQLAKIQDECWDHVDFPDGGEYEELYEAYMHAFEKLDTAFSKSIKLLEKQCES